MQISPGYHLRHSGIRFVPHLGCIGRHVRIGTWLASDDSQRSDCLETKRTWTDESLKDIRSLLDTENDHLILEYDISKRIILHGCWIFRKGVFLSLLTGRNGHVCARPATPLPLTASICFTSFIVLVNCAKLYAYDLI